MTGIMAAGGLRFTYPDKPPHRANPLPAVNIHSEMVDGFKKWMESVDTDLSQKFSKRDF